MVLRLRLELPSPTPVDECLLGTVSLEAGSEPATVSARLNLIEGDLTVTVTRPDESTRTAGWPWPADSGARTATLQPGERLVTGLVLLPLRPASRWSTSRGAMSSGPAIGG